MFLLFTVKVKKIIQFEKYSQFDNCITGNPEIPEIQSQSNSPYPTRIQVQWLVPSDGGSTILEYKLTYQRVSNY